MSGIKELRMKSCMSQKEFAEKMGESQQTVCLWESGKRIPKATVIEKISEVLSVDVKDVLKSIRQEE